AEQDRRPGSLPEQVRGCPDCFRCWDGRATGALDAANSLSVGPEDIDGNLDVHWPGPPAGKDVPGASEQRRQLGWASDGVAKRRHLRHEGPLVGQFVQSAAVSASIGCA